jgi:hypothetical protein
MPEVILKRRQLQREKQTRNGIFTDMESEGPNSQYADLLVVFDDLELDS